MLGMGLWVFRALIAAALTSRPTLPEALGPEKQSNTKPETWKLSVSDLYDLMQAGAAPIIIDTRSATAPALEPRIIPTAIHVPLKDVVQRVRELPTDRDIIVYCACPNEASAARVAKILMSHGLKKVRPLRHDYRRRRWSCPAECGLARALPRARCRCARLPWRRIRYRPLSCCGQGSATAGAPPHGATRSSHSIT